MHSLSQFFHSIELHDVNSLRSCFQNGLNPNDTYNGKPLFDWLVSMYTRSPRFKECIEVFIEAGLQYDDPILLAVLADNSEELASLLMGSLQSIYKRVSLESAYTPLLEVSLLHVCAEFNHLECAKVLLQYGANVNHRAGLDGFGLGGQTPIFHTVNQNGHQSADMLDLLLQHRADLLYTVNGIIWGKDFPWETLIPAVNPVSYAMMGLLPQMHRKEEIINQVVNKLMKHAYGIAYKSANMPNKYLHTESSTNNKQIM